VTDMLVILSVGAVALPLIWSACDRLHTSTLW
jgi:hypothetical protein